MSKLKMFCAKEVPKPDKNIKGETKNEPETPKENQLDLMDTDTTEENRTEEDKTTETNKEDNKTKRNKKNKQRKK
jgi:hypothetical protein